MKEKEKNLVSEICELAKRLPEDMQNALLRLGKDMEFIDRVKNESK